MRILPQLGFFIGSLLLLVMASAATGLASTARPFRLNTVGYLPDAPKRATVVPGKATTFSVHQVVSGKRVYSGPIGPVTVADAGESVATVDFTDIKEPGRYFLRIQDVGESPPFLIAADLYREPFWLVSRAMYLWRCGTEVSGEWQGRHYHHAACHLEDAWLTHVTGTHEKRPSTGGWHDAGDYNKYVVNAGVTLGAMLRAWEDFPALKSVTLNIPESGGALPDFLAELKWQTDWLLTMQAPDSSVYTKVSTERFGPIGVNLRLDECEKSETFVGGASA